MTSRDTELVSSALGRFVARNYSRLPLRRLWLNRATESEGGQFVSRSLRTVLAESYGIRVGAHSYGSLLDPGMCDPHTTIGRYVSIGPHVRRFGAGHPLDRASMHPYWYNPRLGHVGSDQDVDRSPVEIAAEAWIGANVTILPGCRRIGVGAVVGAGSVVTADIPDFAIAVGNPARVISLRLDEESRALLMEHKPWELEPPAARALQDTLLDGRR